MDVLLVATALNRGYNFVTTDKKLVCGLGDGSLLASVGLIIQTTFSTRTYLIHEQCDSLQCTGRER
jgi:hypothetical protein